MKEAMKSSMQLLFAMWNLYLLTCVVGVSKELSRYFPLVSNGGKHITLNYEF